jgi:hypothetical protein
VGDALSDVAERLYVLPPEEFTAARKEAASAARAAGDRGLASEVGQLRRPTVGAWLVNLLAHQRPDLIGELLALGSAMRTAQRNLRGDELRELSQRRKDMVGSLGREARALAVAAGRDVRDALPLAEVEATLSAALADPDIAEQVRLGRLTKTIDYAGFGEPPRPRLRLVQGGAEADKSTLVDEPPVAHPASAVPSKKRSAPVRMAEPPADTAEAAADDAAEVERAAAEERVAQERRAAEEQAKRERAEARRRIEAAHRELLAARTALADAEARRSAADKAVRAARRRVEAAQGEIEANRPD